MSRRLRIRKRKLGRCRNRLIYLQSQLTRLKNLSSDRKKKLDDRWQKISSKIIRIITRIINKIETKLRQRLPQRELEQIVQRALSARYPDAYYRLRNDTQPFKLGTSIFYNLSVIDVGSTRDSLWRCAYDMCMDNLCSSRSVTLAVVTKPVQSYDPRGDWRGAADESVLRVMNPDLLSGTDSSSDSGSESLSSHSGFVLGSSNPELLIDSSSEREGSERSTLNSESDYEIIEQPIIRITSPDSVTQDWSSEKEFEYSDSDSVSRVGEIAPSALSMNASSFSESNSETDESEQSDDSSMTKIDWVSEPFSDFVVPHVPDPYFIDRPDLPLGCLIASALRDSSSSVLGNIRLCSCSNTIHTDPMAGCAITREIIAKDKPIPKNEIIATCEIIAKDNHPKSNIIDRAYKRRNAFHYRKATGTEHLMPLPLTIRKRNNDSLYKMQNGPRPPLPEAPATPYNLRKKMLYGELPPLPSPMADWENQLTHESLEVCVSSSSSASASTPSSTNSSPTRHKSLCSSCRDIRERRRALNSHPIQITHQSNQQCPVPVERTRSDPNDLPSPLRAGTRCTHCRNTWSGIISTPDLLSPQLSTRDEGEGFGDTGPSRANTVDSPFDIFALADVAFNSGEDPYFTEVFSSELRMCLNAGAVARNRRFDNRQFI